MLLNELIQLHRQKSIKYQDYLERIRELVSKVVRPERTTSSYLVSIDTNPKRAFYDNFGKDELLATKIDSAIRYTNKAGLIGDHFKEREIANTIREETANYELDIQAIMALAKA